MMFKRVAVIGGSGAIASALIQQLSEDSNAKIYVFSQHDILFESKNIEVHKINYLEEKSISNSADLASEDGDLDLVIITNGILHNEKVQPEKSLKDLSISKFNEVFLVNTIIPSLIAKYFLPKLNKSSRSVMSFLSAKVGSISDNRLGGWYSYRSSKAALNMIIKNLSIELARLNGEGIVVGLHPGTVESRLSSPFSSNVPKDKLFSPSFAAMKLMEVLSNLDKASTGRVYGWDGKEINP